MQHEQMKDQFIVQGGVHKLVAFVRDCEVDKQSRQQLTDAMTILWSCTLSRPRVVNSIKQDLGCMTRVRQLLDEARADANSNGENTLQQAVDGLLWKVEREEQFEKKKLQKEDSEEQGDQYDLMISYSSADMDLAHRIFHHLQDELGYKIWIDKEQMHGSTIEAMVRLSLEVVDCGVRDVCLCAGECRGPVSIHSDVHVGVIQA